MKIDIITKYEKSKKFFKKFKDGDQTKVYDNKSLLFYSLSNLDLKSRYEISNFLFEKDCLIEGNNSEQQNLFHVLLGQSKHDLPKTISLCKILIDKGLNMNQNDYRNVSPTQRIVNLKFSDEELKPLYDLWFSQTNIDIHHPNFMGYSPFDLAKKLPFRKKLYKRMIEYDKKRNNK